jgi:hypothetical protein
MAAMSVGLADVGTAAGAATLVGSLRRTGAAVVRLGSADAACMAQAEAAATALLVDAPVYVRRRASLLFPEADATAPGLAGYNVPSPAKQVFRIRRGQLQPWPDTSVEDGGGAALAAFRASQEAALAVLERVADACLAAVDAVAAPAGGGDLVARYGTAADVWDDAASLSRSPYDLFYYHNDAHAAGHLNCHAHVDPGILTCVPCARTSGLELLLGDGQWWRPEAPDQGLAPLVDVVIFVGAALAGATGGALPAVVHRVGKAAVPRLSLVYERRPAAHAHTAAESVQRPPAAARTP